MKQCNGCKSWFHQHCENFKIPPNSPYILSTWFCRACQKLPAIHINSLPYTVLDKIFFKVCVADERMFAVIALVCKKWILFINEKFVERVHYAWLDREYDAQSWSKELKISNTANHRKLSSLQQMLQSGNRILQNTYWLLGYTV